MNRLSLPLNCLFGARRKLIDGKRAAVCLPKVFPAANAITIRSRDSTKQRGTPGKGGKSYKSRDEILNREYFFSVLGIPYFGHGVAGDGEGGEPEIGGGW